MMMMMMTAWLHSVHTSTRKNWQLGNADKSQVSSSSSSYVADLVAACDAHEETSMSGGGSEG